MTYSDLENTLTELSPDYETLQLLVNKLGYSSIHLLNVYIANSPSLKLSSSTVYELCDYLETGNLFRDNLGLRNFRYK